MLAGRKMQCTQQRPAGARAVALPRPQRSPRLRICSLARAPRREVSRASSPAPVGISQLGNDTPVVSQLDSGLEAERTGLQQPAVGQTEAAWLAWWAALPARYRVVIATSMSFVICNMDKVNMSVAIIPMAQDFGWSPSIAGLIQSAFFWGYILCQLPGGYLSSRYGGRRVMPAGVGMWSLSTAAVPLLASTVPGLCFSRAAVGLGEAVAPSAATDMVARIVPPEERSRAVSFVFGGLHVGSILGLLAAPALITHCGWESVFVVFGAAGLAWVLWFEQLMAGMEAADPEVAALLAQDRLSQGATSTAAAASAASTSSSSHAAEDHSSSGSHGGHAAGPLTGTLPWRAFLRSRAVQVLMYTHFCNNWFHYTMLAWLPTYFVDTLSVDLMHAAQTALLPPLAGIAASAVAGPAADGLVAAGWKVSSVRKLAQSIAFLVPTACLLAAAASDDSTLTVAAITAALGISSFSLAGLYCTHQDLSPRYSSALLGVTNTSGAVPGIVGVAVTGMLYDQTGSWPLALFIPTSLFLVTGAAAYVLAGSNDPEDFDAPAANTPFAWEAQAQRLLAKPLQAWRQLQAQVQRSLRKDKQQ